jgi:hypothetical protein
MSSAMATEAVTVTTATISARILFSFRHPSLNGRTP